MIIVEQEKTYLINFDNTTQITLATDKEEKAKEVLQEIIEHYNELKINVTYAQGDGGFTFNTKFYYEMPKE